MNRATSNSRGRARRRGARAHARGVRTRSGVPTQGGAGSSIRNVESVHHPEPSKSRASSSTYRVPRPQSPALPLSPALYLECGMLGTASPASNRPAHGLPIADLPAALPPADMPPADLPPAVLPPAVLPPSPPPVHRNSEILEVLENLGSEADEDDDDDDEDFRFGHGRFRMYRSDIYNDWDEDDDVQLPPVVIDHVETATTAGADPVGPISFFDFKWRKFSDTPISPDMRRETFSSEHGPTAPNADPYDNFIAIWDCQIMEHIAAETNAYAQEVAANMAVSGRLGPQSWIWYWKEVTVDELYTLWAIFMAMGIVVKGSLTDYWNTAADDIFITPGFREYMPLRRFQLLCSCLHFNRNGQMPSSLDHGRAKLYKIQPILDHLNNKFQTLYGLSRSIILDESLLQWSSWLNVNRIIPNMEIKSYEICESHTGYLWRFEIHSIKNTLPPSTDPMCAATSGIVLRLMQGLENRGHTLWMDSYYNSPALARKLKSMGTDCVGTLRTHRQFVPDSIKNLTIKDMRPGQMVSTTSGDVDVLVWRDRRRVATISTYYGNHVTDANGSLTPVLLYDYNTIMGSVEKKDRILSAFPMELKRTKIWYKKLFRHLLNVSIFNACIISKQSGSTLSHREFRDDLILAILAKHAHNSQPVEPPQ